MDLTPAQILDRFGIPLESIACVYPYGSYVYGANNEFSDRDWIVVYRSSMLPSGSFRDNAISSVDRSHQAVCYSRSGFRNAIDTYDIVALECAFLPREMVMLETMSFPVRKWVPKDMAKAIISKASSSWHMAMKGSEDDERTRKNAYHAIRILKFGQQMAEHARIVDFSVANELRSQIMEDEGFDGRKYMSIFNGEMDKLRQLVNA